MKFSEQLRAFQLKAEGLAENTTRLAVLDVWSRLIVRSPVDTGRFRAAWRFQEDTLVAVGPIPDGGSSDSPLPAPAPPDLPERVIGRRFYIVNNVSYGQALEEGGSNQAPNGMVRLTAKDWPQIVRRAARAARQ